MTEHEETAQGSSEAPTARPEPNTEAASGQSWLTPNSRAPVKPTPLRSSSKPC